MHWLEKVHKNWISFKNSNFPSIIPLSCWKNEFFIPFFIWLLPNSILMLDNKRVFLSRHKIRCVMLWIYLQISELLCKQFPENYVWNCSSFKKIHFRKKFTLCQLNERKKLNKNVFPFFNEVVIIISIFISSSSI